MRGSFAMKPSQRSMLKAIHALAYWTFTMTYQFLNILNGLNVQAKYVVKKNIK